MSVLLCASLLTGVALMCVFGSVLSSVAIGEYGNPLNRPECGRNRFTPKPYTLCLKWHKNMGPSLTESRNALQDEAPWMVHIMIVDKVERYDTKARRVIRACSGVLISKRFVLTAASCLALYYSLLYEYPVISFQLVDQMQRKWKVKNDPNFKVHNNFHDAFVKLARGQIDREDVPEPDKYYDLAVLRIYNYVSQNPKSICLPDRASEIGPNQFVMTATAHTYFSNVNVHLSYQLKNLTIDVSHGYTTDNVLLRQDNKTYHDVIKKNTFLERPESNTSLDCNEDIGAPIWQYEYGRAVLVGIRIGFTQPVLKKHPYNFCSSLQWPEGYVNYGIGLKINPFIDWIVNVTKYY